MKRLGSKLIGLCEKKKKEEEEEEAQGGKIGLLGN